jgi:hypothetical protein
MLMLDRKRRPLVDRQIDHEPDGGRLHAPAQVAEFGHGPRRREAQVPRALLDLVQSLDGCIDRPRD